MRLQILQEMADLPKLVKSFLERGVGDGVNGRGLRCGEKRNLGC